MEAIDFGDFSENLNTAAHNNEALFEQYEPLVAMNDDTAGSFGADDPAIDNLYMIPTW